MTFRGFSQVLAPQEFGPPTGQITIGAAEEQGTAGTAAEADHVHAVPAAAAGQGATDSKPGDVEADGTATTPARSDHVHGREPAAAVATVTTPAAGTVYQNTTGSPLHITVPVTLTPTSTVAAAVSLGVGTTSTPATATAAQAAAAGTAVTVPISFVVPAGCYFVLETTGTVTIGAPWAATL